MQNDDSESLLNEFRDVTQAKMTPRKWCWGLVSRRECSVPTWRGLLLLALLGIALTVVGVLSVHSFLAITERVPAAVLVVEGWVPDYVLEEAGAEFQRHHYAKLYVTGGPLETGQHLSEYKTYAELGAATLIRLGVSKNALKAVPAPWVRQDRTYTSAVILRNWLRLHNAIGTNINVISLGAHARRTRLLFRMAFEDGSRVGIIAIKDRDYAPDQWWQSSQGARTVIDELVAYIYARTVFPFV